MGTIAGASNAVRMLKASFPEEIVDALRNSETLIKDIIQDQLMAGKDENLNPLTPTYLDDPYFVESTSTPKAAKEKAKNYKKWKAKLYPPTTTDILHLRARSANTPNLIIRGDYHASITPIVMKDKIVTQSIGFYASDDIERKYGPEHLGLSARGKEYLINEKIYPAIAKLFKKYGLK